MRCYTESGSIVELLDGWRFCVTHIQLLLSMQAHVEGANVRCRDPLGVEYHRCVGTLNLDSELLRLLNPNAA